MARWPLMHGVKNPSHPSVGDPARHTIADRRSAGAELRHTVPRSALAEWQPAANRPDPVAVLHAQDSNRIASLLPERYRRMRPSPFTFLRGAAAVMAIDLGESVNSGLRVQACGDCHLANFGSYESPEGRPVFDVNDFDETLPAPFEWDLKRLATSLVLAGRDQRLPDAACEDLAVEAAQSYARAMNTLADLPPLVAWRSAIDLVSALSGIDKGRVQAEENRRLAAVLRGGKTGFGLISDEGGRWRIRDKPPQVVHDLVDDLPFRGLLSGYADTLPPERRVLLQRYRLRDVAFKVVGIGSVGTVCAIGLFTDADGNPLLLQIKQAQQSVLSTYAGASAFANQGERVVVGQRMLQAASDIFLGWTQPDGLGRHFYMRALKDQRLAAIGETMEASMPFYAALCGRTLARAHARTGDAPAIAGYIGSGRGFARSIARFAVAYARQSVRDWRAFCAALDAGTLPAGEAAR